MALELRLPPGKTAVIQLKVRTVGSNTPGANVGSPITATASGADYTFALGSYNTGDYWAQLTGVSDPVGKPFPVRDGIAYVGCSWDQVDVFAPLAPTAPRSIVTGLCNVVVAVTFNGEIVVGANVSCHLEAKNNTLFSGYLASRAVETGTTDALGYCVLTLIQISQFSRGGVYVLKVHDENGKCLQDRRVTVPNTSECNAEDLVDVL